MLWISKIPFYKLPSSQVFTADVQGSFAKRPNGTWSERITIGTDPETGKKKTKVFYGKTRKEVSDKMAKVNEGSYFEPTKQTVGEYLENWLSLIKPCIKITMFEMQVRKHIRPAIGHVKLQQLQTKHIQDLINKRLRKGYCQ